MIPITLQALRDGTWRATAIFRMPDRTDSRNPVMALAHPFPESDDTMSMNLHILSIRKRLSLPILSKYQVFWVSYALLVLCFALATR